MQTERPQVDFWFTAGSTYTYLSVMRLPAVARETGIAFRWRPFHLGKLFNALGYQPFVGKPAKTAYMWRDIERRAEGYGVPVPPAPPPYPLPDSRRANLLAHLGMREGWGEGFVTASYRRWFMEGLPTGEEPNRSASLREAGQDPEAALARAIAPENDASLQEETDLALRLGLCGSPCFVVGAEVFWGDDRLEDAIAWLRHGTLRRDRPAGPVAAQRPSA